MRVGTRGVVKRGEKRPARASALPDRGHCGAFLPPRSGGDRPDNCGPGRSRAAWWPALFLAFFLSVSGSIQAQHLGSVSGRIHDESGAVISGAVVSIRGAALQGRSPSSASDREGRYFLPGIPAGRYEIEAALPGFATELRRNVLISVNEEITLDFTLRVADISDLVQVESTPPSLEPSRSDIHSRVSMVGIEALPLNGRDFVDLLGLVPGSKPDPGGDQGREISIFGERGAAISYLVDGGDNNDPLNGGPLQNFTQDSIQEFEVITTGYAAEFGRAQGGVANIITRSGTNEWAGSGFLFVRDHTLDSSNVQGQEVPQLNRSQWGLTLGGPVKRDHTFLLGSLEVLDETRGVNIDRSQLPEFAAAGSGTPSGLENFDLGPRTDGFIGLLKLDSALTDAHRLHGLFNHSRRDISGEISSPVAGTVALPSAARREERRSDSLTLREVWTLRTNTLLESTGKILDGDSGSNLDRTERLEPVLLLLRSGFLQTGAPFGGKSARQPVRFQLGQALSHLESDWKGSHLLKLGWEWNRVSLEGFNEVTNDVEYSAAFLDADQAGRMAELFDRFGFQQAAARFFTLSGNPDGGLDLDMTNHDLSFFVQDQWRVREDLTLNAGLRYDYASLFSEDKDNWAPRVGFAWDPGGRHRTVLRGGFGFFFDRNLLSAAATVPELGGVFTRSVFDVALPRLGSTYTDSLIDLVITSGFPQAGGGRRPPENALYQGFAEQLRQDPLALYRLLDIEVADPARPPVVTADNLEALSGRTPREAVELLESTFPGTDWEFWDVPGGSIVGDRVLAFFPRGPLGLTRDVSRFSRARTPWTRAFNLSLEQQVAGDVVLSANYVHRRSRDLLTRRIVNLFDVPPGDPNFGRTIDGGPRINQVTYEGRVDYDGLVLELRKRFGRSYSFHLAYTLSRARDNLLTSNVGSTFTDNNRPELDYGPSNQSAPHLFAASAVVALPWGVHLSAISYWRSGDAFNPRGITDQDGDGLVDQRDIAQPRNGFRTDPFFNLDLRVEKRFEISEGHQIGLLVEAFNSTNRSNVKNVNSVSGPDFGIPNNFFPGREIQVGLRYRFGGR